MPDYLRQGKRKRQACQIQDASTMEEQEDRYKVKFQFPGLVPEEEHRPKSPKRPDERRSEKGGFGDPPATCPGGMLIVAVQAEDTRVCDHVESKGKIKEVGDHASALFFTRYEGLK